MTKAAIPLSANALRPAVTAMLAADAALLEGFEKILTFNLQVGKALLEESAQACQASLGNPDDAARSMTNDLPKDTLEKFSAYCRQVQTVGSEVQTALVQVMQTYLNETDQQMRAAIGTVAKQAAMLTPPAGANGPIDGWLKAVTQAAEEMTASTRAALNQMGDGSSAAPKAAKSRATA